MYESDITRFLRALRQERPQLEAEQKKGRALLWDRELDRDQLAAQARYRVPQQPYVYQTKV
ncbi:MAG: DUF3460 family protein [Burkholderiales bacterium]|nr:DUF3460 family protein [Burkholderiales bacterium]